MSLIANSAIAGALSVHLFKQAYDVSFQMTVNAE